MGQGQSGQGGADKPDPKKEKKRFEPPPPPTRVGKKQRKRGAETASRLPTVTPTSKCKLRLLKLERVKDYLLMEEEFVTNQERLKPQEARNEEERTKVDDLRGTPMSVGNLEEIIDDRRAARHAAACARRAPRLPFVAHCLRQRAAFESANAAPMRRAQPRDRVLLCRAGVLRQHHVVRGQVAGVRSTARLYKKKPTRLALSRQRYSRWHGARVVSVRHDVSLAAGARLLSAVAQQGAGSGGHPVR